MKRFSASLLLSSSVLFLSSIAFAATPAVSKPAPALAPAKPAVAQASSSAPSLGELTFFPEEKTFVSTTSLDYNSEFYSTVPPSGDSTDFHVHTTTLSDTLEYSFLKNQALFLTLDYAEIAQRQNSGGMFADYAARGFSNPGIGYKIRLLEEGNAHQFNFDLGGALAPDLLDSKTIHSGDGTVASGNTVVSAFANLTGQKNELIWGFTPQVVYHGYQTRQYGTTNTNITTDAFVSFSLKGQGQYVINRNLLLDFGLDFAFIPTTNTTYSGVTHDRDYYTVFGIKGGITDTLIPNKLVTFIALQATKTTDSTVTSGGTKRYTYSNESGFGPVAGFSIVL